MVLTGHSDPKVHRRYWDASHIRQLPPEAMPQLPVSAAAGPKPPSPPHHTKRKRPPTRRPHSYSSERDTGLGPAHGITFPNVYERLCKVVSSLPPSEFAAKCATFRYSDDSPDDLSGTASLRQELLVALTLTISRATAVGDLNVVRIAHEALGRLIEEPELGNLKVADLDVERAKRKQR